MPTPRAFGAAFLCLLALGWWFSAGGTAPLDFRLAEAQRSLPQRSARLHRPAPLTLPAAAGLTAPGHGRDGLRAAASTPVPTAWGSPPGAASPSTGSWATCTASAGGVVFFVVLVLTQRWYSSADTAGLRISPLFAASPKPKGPPGTPKGKPKRPPPPSGRARPAPPRTSADPAGPAAAPAPLPPAPPAFLPDHSPREECRWLYPRLAEWLFAPEGAPLEVMLMPNIYGKSGPEFETSWLMLMEQILNLSGRELVVAHGSSAEAVLRYLERHPLRKCILIDAPATCLATDQGGREYRWDAIAQHCPAITLLAVAGGRAADAAELRQRLAVGEAECIVWGDATPSTPEQEAEAFSKLRRAIVSRLPGVSEGVSLQQ